MVRADIQYEQSSLNTSHMGGAYAWRNRGIFLNSAPYKAHSQG